MRKKTLYSFNVNLLSNFAALEILTNVLNKGSKYNPLIVDFGKWEGPAPYNDYMFFKVYHTFQL